MQRIGQIHVPENVFLVMKKFNESGIINIFVYEAVDVQIIN